MRTRTMLALLLASLLGACAEFADTADLLPAEGDGRSFSEPATTYCGACRYASAGAWHAERPMHGTGGGHVEHERQNRHRAQHDHDRRGKP